MSNDLEALLERVKKHVEEREMVTIPVVFENGEDAGVRVLPSTSSEWNRLTAMHPPREEIMRDMRLGYDVTETVKAYPNVSLILGEKVDDMMRPQEDGTHRSIWPDVFDSLDAKSQKRVLADIWGIHETHPDAEVGAAGKA